MANIAPQETLRQAMGAYRAGRFVEAAQLCRTILELQSDFFDALNLHAASLQVLGHRQDSLLTYERALILRPDHSETFNNRGVILKDQMCYAEALASYDRALTIRPDNVTALYNRANTLLELRRYDHALMTYEQVLVLQPDHGPALYNHGSALRASKQFDEALVNYERALAVSPNDVDAFNNRGNTLMELKRFGDALASYEQALVIDPEHVDAFNNCGIAFKELRRFAAALTSYERALALRPTDVNVLFNRGVAFKELRRFVDAQACYEQALMVQPNYAPALYNRATTFHYMKLFDQALANYQRAIIIEPEQKSSINGLADCAIKLCDWTLRQKMTAEIGRRISDRTSIIDPFASLSYSDDLLLLLTCAKNYTQDTVAVPRRPLWQGTIWRNDRIKLAYVSADFRNHPISYLMAELFELHDRSRFEVIGLSLGSEDGSAIRMRLAAGFDQFIEVETSSDEEVAHLLNQRRVDISIDLMGHTERSRPQIFAFRPTPIQVNYLGFPGTTGASFVDYIIADQIVLPFDQQSFYTENIIHLPCCYQVNDRKRAVSTRTMRRGDFGLPQDSFVFCCFNNSWKITPAVFDIWMRLLRSVEHSVFWLLRDNSVAEINLRREASARGVDPRRLVFAERVPLEEHLARHRLADLFLDTLPYNAHTTASDALWMGLPVLTCQGNAFAGRVASSLLYAIGVPELVARNLADYEALALKLSRERGLLSDFKVRITCNRETHPLFDTDRFCRSIEAAYERMWEIWQRGEAPRPFAIAPTVKADSAAH